MAMNTLICLANLLSLDASAGVSTYGMKDCARVVIVQAVAPDFEGSFANSRSPELGPSGKTCADARRQAMQAIAQDKKPQPMPPGCTNG